jgi:hypothetical protein
MSRFDVRKWLNGTLTDFEFTYNNKEGSVCPFPDFVSLSYDGKTEDFEDVDSALLAPLFNGKSLSEIADEIDW